MTTPTRASTSGAEPPELDPPEHGEAVMVAFRALVYSLDARRPVGIGEARLALLAIEDRARLTARSDHELAWHGALAVTMCGEFGGVLERLERGEWRRAARRFRAVLRLRIGLRDGPPDWTQIEDRS